jgi:hypothetical protein
MIEDEFINNVRDYEGNRYDDSHLSLAAKAASPAGSPADEARLIPAWKRRKNANLLD